MWYGPDWGPGHSLLDLMDNISATPPFGPSLPGGIRTRGLKPFCLTDTLPRSDKTIALWVLREHVDAVCQEIKNEQFDYTTQKHDANHTAILLNRGDLVSIISYFFSGDYVEDLNTCPYLILDHNAIL